MQEPHSVSAISGELKILCSPSPPIVIIFCTWQLYFYQGYIHHQYMPSHIHSDKFSTIYLLASIELLYGWLKYWLSWFFKTSIFSVQFSLIIWFFEGLSSVKHNHVMLLWVALSTSALIWAGIVPIGVKTVFTKFQLSGHFQISFSCFLYLVCVIPSSRCLSVICCIVEFARMLSVPGILIPYV